MLWYGYSGLICLAVAGVVVVLAGSAAGVIPELVGWYVGGAAASAGLSLLMLDGHVMRRRDRDRYRKAGFIVEPPNFGQRVDDLMVFRVFGSRATYSDCHYWLPEAPQARAYELFYQMSGKVLGHLVTTPTSAPQGVAVAAYRPRRCVGHGRTRCAGV